MFDALVEHVLEHLVDLFLPFVRHEAHRPSEVRGADHDAVHAVDGQDVVEVFDCFQGFYLRPDDHFVVGDCRVVFGAAVVYRPFWPPASHAARRKLCGLHGLLHGLRGVGQRHYHAVRPCVERGVDEMRLVERHANDDFLRPAQARHHAVERRNVDLAVLRVDEEEVEVRFSQRTEGCGMVDSGDRANDGLAVQQSLLDAVLHSSLLGVRSALRRRSLSRRSFRRTPRKRIR